MGQKRVGCVFEEILPRGTSTVDTMPRLHHATGHREKNKTKEHLLFFFEKREEKKGLSLFFVLEACRAIQTVHRIILLHDK